MKYLPHVDSLRAIAVICVLIHHWFPHTFFDIGGYGVTLFFVISGYLITKTIDQLRTSHISVGNAAKQFFLRRTLRLFPAYYLLIGISFFIFSDVRENVWWYLTYCSNFLLVSKQELIALTPTWSLAVEEQFYLIWFFVVIYLRRSHVAWLAIMMLLTAPVFRLIYLYDENEFGRYFYLWTRYDGLAAGVLLFYYEKRPFWKMSLTLSAVISIVAALVVLGLLVLWHHAYWKFCRILLPRCFRWHFC